MSGKDEVLWFFIQSSHQARSLYALCLTGGMILPNDVLIETIRLIVSPNPSVASYIDTCATPNGCIVNRYKISGDELEHCFVLPVDKYLLTSIPHTWPQPSHGYQHLPNGTLTPVTIGRVPIASVPRHVCR
eukprot:PhF_6_TR17384/c0_g1_i1/m.26615